MIIKSKHIPLVALLLLLLHACASIGTPEGGPRDYSVPQFVSAKPEQGATGVKTQKFTLYFDELIQLKDQQKLVVVSPVQRNMPRIAAQGKRINIELRDTLLPSTTYVIDFADAIVDNNEGNRMPSFNYAFSTGETIDTMGVSGIVLRARDLEPMQYVLVGLHSNLDDSAFTALPFERIARTDDRGRFTVMGVAPGEYHVFALRDMDGDYRMARSEDYAFLDTIIVPSMSSYTSMDTVFTFDHKVDTVIEAEHPLMLPNDILLAMFNEGYRASYLKTTARLDRQRLQVVFAAPLDTPATVRPISPDVAGKWATVERFRTALSDSSIYWLTDTVLLASDTIRLSITYPKTVGDSVVETTDTVNMVQRRSNAELKAEREKEKVKAERRQRLDKFLARQAQGKQLDEDELVEMAELARDTVPVVPHLKLVAKQGGNVIEVTDSLRFTVNEPIAAVNNSMVHLRRLHVADSTWTDVAIPPLLTDGEDDRMGLVLPLTLEPDSTYRFEMDSLAVTSIYGVSTDKYSREFKVKDESQYGTVTLNITGIAAGERAIVQLLDTREAAVRQHSLRGSGTVTFANVLPEYYFVKLILDRNDNGVWDTGNYSEHLQPEDVFYYPQRLRVRRNWDITQDWNIYATAVDKQKPEQIKRNKPESKSKLEPQRQQSGQDEEEDEFNSNAFGEGIYSGNRYRDYQNRR